MSLESTIPDRFLATVALKLEIISRLTLSAIIISNAQLRVACLGGCIPCMQYQGVKGNECAELV